MGRGRGGRAGLLRREFVRLSEVTFRHRVIACSSFLGLGSRGVLRALPGSGLCSECILFNKCSVTRHRVTTFVPRTLSLHCIMSSVAPGRVSCPFYTIGVRPGGGEFSRSLARESFLNSVLGLKVSHSGAKSVLIARSSTLLFVGGSLMSIMARSLAQIHRAIVSDSIVGLSEVGCAPSFRRVGKAISSIHLSDLLPLTFSSSEDGLSKLVRNTGIFMGNGLVADGKCRMGRKSLVSMHKLNGFHFRRTKGVAGGGQVDMAVRGCMWSGGLEGRRLVSS